MTYTWEYPIYVVRCDGGFLAVEVDSETEQRRFALAVFSNERRGTDFLHAIEVEGQVACLDNDREFAALVARLRPPFTAVVFDSAPQGGRAHAAWQVEIHRLLEDHLPLARSPWDYPLFALREPGGYTSIHGVSADGQSFVAAGLFTRRDLADVFASDADIRAEVVEIDSPQRLSDLLADLPQSVAAAAFNPTANGRQRSAKHCLRIRDIRNKYLPEGLASE